MRRANFPSCKKPVKISPLVWKLVQHHRRLISHLSVNTFLAPSISPLKIIDSNQCFPNSSFLGVLFDASSNSIPVSAPSVTVVEYVYPSQVYPLLASELKSVADR